MNAPIPRRDDVPPELIKRRFWINWRPTLKADGDWNKVPWSGTLGHAVDAHDRNNWMSFSQALVSAKEHDLGVGFVLSKDDPYAGLDLDECFVADDELHPAARDLVSGLLGKTYAEVTPSNNGLRILVQHSKNGGRSKNDHAQWDGKFEFYDNGRFFTLTGWSFEDSPMRIGAFPSEISRIEGEALGNGSEARTGLGTSLVHGAEAGKGDRHEANKAVIVSMRLAGATTPQIEAVIRNLCANYRDLMDERRIEDEVRQVYDSEHWNLAHEARVLQETERERSRRQARRIVDSEEASLSLPPAPTMSLRQELAQPEEPEAYAIDELALEDGNVLIPALRKRGKTTLLFNVVKSLVDGDNFLSRFEVRPLEGSAVVLSYEMLPKASRRWMGKLGVERQDQVRFWHLRGWSLPFWLPDVMSFAAEQLRAWECEALLIDSAGAASDGLVKNFNDRAQVTAFTMAVDQLKRLAGVRECYMLIHMGWAALSAEDDEAHTLGSEAWEAWADMIWPYEKDKDGTMMLRPFGRLDDEPPPPFSVRWNKKTNVLTAGADRVEHREVVGVRAVCEAMTRLPDGCTSTELRDEIVGVEKEERSPLIQAAEDRGLITRSVEGRAKRCWITPAGRKLVGGSNVQRAVVEG